MRRSFSRTLLAVLTLLAMVVQGTWVLAGTTGRLAGTVTESAGNQPVSGAAVNVSSPSQSASTTTDPQGRFSFLSLAPDTYTVTITKPNYVTVTQAGITIQADGSVDLSYTATRSLTVIGKTAARASTEIVRPGQVQDVYSVNSAAQTTVQALGGGGNLNSAYSALASVPGVTVPYGGSGTGQTLFIHGSSYSQVGYEYDGVPVNRAFDNYNGNSLSNLGQQELQVITSGSSASSSSATVAGFINQVIRSGTYPGYKNLQLDFGVPTFYNAGRLEFGGASPDRNFSYYIGGLLSKQGFRILDQANGGAFGTAPFGNNGFDNQYTTIGGSGPASNGFPGVYPECRYNMATNSIDSPFALAPGTPGARTPGTGGDPGCAVFNPPLAFYSLIPSRVNDNEIVTNLHFGLPHRGGTGRDDIQLLYSGSALLTKYQNSFNDVGGPGSIASVMDANFNVTGDPFPIWRDATVFPQNTPFLADASTVHGVPYFFPSSPVGRAFHGAVDPALEDGTGNDAEIVKLQYQKNFNNAYLRAYGYTMYSDWLQNGPNYGGTGAFFASVPSRDYELISHTRGGEIQYATQLGAKNLLTATANYTAASVTRFNNSTFLTTSTTAATSFTDGTNCYSFTTGALRSCYSGGTGGTIGTPIPAAFNPAAIAGTPAAAAGASFRVTYNGFNGNRNTVDPVFTSFSLTDEMRPTDKLLINGGLRLESYTYKRPGADDAAYKFWFNQAANSYCYDLRTGQPFLTPLTANPAALGSLPPVQIGFNNTCGVAAGPGQTSPTGRVDPATGDPVGNPNGQFGTVNYTTTAANTLTRTVFQPRLGLTYTLNPDTVLRFSGGLYTEPFNTATVQYLNLSPKAAATADFASFFGFGFNTPNHDFDPSKSVNLDASLEKHIRGTDISYKFSPFYRYTKNQYQDFFIGAGFVSQLPTGNETSYGAEFQIRKSDPSREGLSAQLSYTYTNGFMKFNKLGNGSTPVTQTNAVIDAYNALTRAGNRNGQAGAPCYVGGVGASSAGTINGVQVCNPGSGTPTLTAAGAGYTDANGNQVIVNPYYNQSPGGYYSEVGPYPVYQTFVNDDFFLLNLSSNEQSIIEPHGFSGFVNYRKKKWDFAVAGTMAIGTAGANGISRYGSPYTALGIDPRTCANNQTTVPTAANPGLANYISCGTSIARGGALFVPNPETGRFDGYGEFRQPWVLNLNASVAYELSKTARANVVLSNLFNRCFGGSKTPWSAAYTPGSNGVCIFSPNTLTYTGAGWFNGSSPNDVAANGIAARNVQQHSYAPSAPLFLPFQMSVQLQFKL